MNKSYIFPVLLLILSITIFIVLYFTIKDDTSTDYLLAIGIPWMLLTFSGCGVLFMNPEDNKSYMSSCGLLTSQLMITLLMYFI
jgi:hypothetical protein